MNNNWQDFPDTGSLPIRMWVASGAVVLPEAKPMQWKSTVVGLSLLVGLVVFLVY